MTVQVLIEALKGLPGDAQVVVYTTELGGRVETCVCILIMCASLFVLAATIDRIKNW